MEHKSFPNTDKGQDGSKNPKILRMSLMDAPFLHFGSRFSGPSSPPSPPCLVSTNRQPESRALCSPLLHKGRLFLVRRRLLCQAFQVSFPPTISDLMAVSFPLLLRRATPLNSFQTLVRLSGPLCLLCRPAARLGNLCQIRGARDSHSVSQYTE